VTPRTIRRLVLAVFVTGIGGMIFGSILDNNGVAITFGLITAGAAVGLILVTAVAPQGAFRSRQKPMIDDCDHEGSLIEAQVEILVAGGADEIAVRELVRRSITFGREDRGARP